MRVYRVDLFRRKTGVCKSPAHTEFSAGAIVAGSIEIEGVLAHAETNDFCDYCGATFTRGVECFQNHCARAVRQRKSLTTFIKRTARHRRVAPIVDSNGLQSGKTDQVKWRQHHTRSACDARIGVSVLNQPERFTNCLGSRCAGSSDHASWSGKPRRQIRKAESSGSMYKTISAHLESV